MKTYRLKTEVPWALVLKMVRLDLEMRMENCRRAERITTGDKRFLYDELESWYKAYRSLRRFLGYTNPNKLELRALDCLQKQFS